MRTINVTEFRNHLPKYLSSVQRGHELLITSHGEVIARITPPIDTKQAAQQQLKNLRKHCKVGDVLTSVDEAWDAEK